MHVLSTIKVHYSELLKSTEERQVEKERGVKRKRVPNDSHEYLNKNAKKKIEIRNEERYLNKEIPMGHTGRKEFVPLMKQRGSLEETVNNAMVAGIVLNNSKPQLSHPLLDYAKETRLKSQETQRKMNELRNAGHIDHQQYHSDNLKTIEADKLEKKELQMQKARKQNRYNAYRNSVYKNRFRGKYL